MKEKSFIVIVLCCCFSWLLGNKQLQFENISISDGLSHGTVNDILRDRDGFLWICTEDGLNRYDGYTIKQYQLNGVTENIVYASVIESDDDKLWFGTSIGLLVYSPQIDSLADFRNITQVDPAIEHFNSRINTLFKDKSNKLWVASWAGLFAIDIDDKAVSDIDASDITFYSNRQQPDSNQTDVIIYSIAQDSEGLIWMTSGSSKLTCYNPETRMFSSVEIQYPPLQRNTTSFRKILIDQNDNIYIYTEGDGIVFWDRATDTFEEFKLFDNSGQELKQCIVRTMMIDESNRLWIGTDGHGFFIYDGHSFDQYNHERKGLLNLSCDVIYDIYEDPERNVWIGTYLAGLNKLSNAKTNFGLVSKSSDPNMGLSGELVFNFLEDHKGYVWIATDGGGLNKVDPKTNVYTHYFPDPKQKKSISTKTTIALFQDRNHDIWIGSYNGGLNRYNYASDDFTTFYTDPNDSNSICSNHPWGFAEDHDGNLWIASNSHGIDLKRPNEERFINYSDNIDVSNEKRLLSSNALTHLLVDSRNYLWIGTEGGLDKVFLDKMDFTQDRPELVVEHFYMSNDSNSISSNQISYLAEGPGGDIWIGTKGGGLNRYMIEKDSFVIYSIEDGLPHNTIQGIVFDNDNRAWLSTSNGLSSFDVNTMQFENYTKDDGLQDNLFIKTSCYKARDGQLFFGGIKGYNEFYPSQLVKNSHSPDVKITSFKLFNKEVKINEEINGRIILDRSITHTDYIELEHRNNFITFEFSALDFTNSQKNEYAYMMEGFDAEWVYTNADSRRATYTNLNPGDYVFRVIASNNNGVWNEDGASITIKILPPWWATWWFRFFMIVFIFGLISLAFYLRILQLRNQKQKLHIQVEEQTEQLRAANESLKETNATKDKFFSIIAHDVISPFNAILGLTELLKDKYDALSSERIEELIILINRSSKQLHELLMNLLEWSRSERGSLSFNPEVIDLHSTIANSVELNGFVAQNKGVKLELDVPDAALQAYTDEQMIKTILRNLQSNAIKFTPVGGTIRVKVVEDNSFFKVSIIDDGVGMDAEMQKQIFDPNNFASTKGTNNESGTGLGLKLVYEFVKMQGGDIWVTSEEGKGCEFCFTVPVAS